MALTDLAEATPETTSEEIASYADTVAEEVVQERQEERKSDAEIVARNSPPTKQSAEPKSSSAEAEKDQSKKSAKADSQSESGSVTEAPEWLTDDVKAELSAYGISEAELSDFSSREELERAIRLFDKTALEAGRKAMAEGGDASRNEKGQFVKKEGSEESEESTPEKRNYEVSLSADKWEDDIVNEFSRMRDHYESRFQALESQLMIERVRSEEERFDNFVDSLGHTDLFGNTGKESTNELERRKDLLVAVKAHMIGLEALGRPTTLNERLIGRVAHMVFSDELGKKLIKQQTSKVSKQNQLRQGGSPTKPLPPRDDPREEADRLYRELSGF